MSSKEKKGKNSKKGSKAAVKLPESVKAPPPPAVEIKEVPNDEDEVDLSSLEIASTISDVNFPMDGPKLVLSDNVNESYKDILSTCSSTANDIKQSINDVLNSRERLVITEVDPTEELQENLNKKIADFAQVVGGSFASNEVISETPIEKEPKEMTPEAQIPESSPSTEVEPQEPTVPTEPTNEVSETKNSKKIEPVVTEQDEKVLPPPQVVELVKEFSKSPSPVDEDRNSKKQKNGASKKKGDKSLDQILKSLGNANAEEKLQVIGKKYMETLEELKVHEIKLKQLERKVVTQYKDKELSQAENNRLILAKSRLESLCRELQKQNKIIREESSIRLKLEEEKRKEIATKFQVTLTDISGLMQENSKSNTQLRAENAELATKLKSLVDNYEVWEQNVTKVVHQKELEVQLANAKHAKVNLLLKQESEKFLREKQSLLENLSELQKRCTMLASNELQLRTELADYTSKYEEFQSVLTNSSKVFATFKTDMDATSKKIKNLEKETNLYKQKWENSNKALLEMIGHKNEQDKDFSTAQQRIATLEKLCRALQTERNDLRNQLKTITPNSESATSEEVPDVTTTESSV